MNTQQQRLEICKKCPKRDGVTCEAVTDDVLSILVRVKSDSLPCPLNRWPVSKDVSIRKAPTMAWFFGDLAKGGISNYVRTVIPALHNAGYKHTGIVIGSNIDLDVDTLDVLTAICPVYVLNADYGKCPKNLTKVGIDIYQTLINASAFVQLVGNHPKHHYFPENLNWADTTAFVQAHGVCDWTTRVVEYGMQYATKLIAVSQAVKAYLIGLGYRSDDIYVIRPVIDRNRCTQYLSQNDARLAFLDKNQNNRYELDQNDALRGVWLTYYGRLAPEKGIYRIARAVAAFRRFCLTRDAFNDDWLSNVTLLIVGGGLLEDETVRELLAINATRSILCGWTESPADVLSASDMTLCMSDNEGGPLTVPESIIGCCPVASTGVGVVPELVFRFNDHHRLMYTPLTSNATSETTAVELYGALVNRKTGYISHNDREAAEECSRLFSLRAALDAWRLALK